MGATKRDYQVSIICMFVLSFCFLIVAIFGYFYKPNEVHEYGIVVDISGYDVEFNLYRWKNRKSVVNTADVRKKYTISCDINVHDKEFGMDHLRERMFGCVKHVISHVENYEIFNSTIFVYGTELTRLMCETEFDKCNSVFGVVAEVITSFQINVVTPNVKPLTGYEEALFGWITVNRYLNNIRRGKKDKEAYGGLDLKNYSVLLSFEKYTPHVPNSTIYNSSKHVLCGYEYDVVGLDMMCYGVRQGYDAALVSHLKEASTWSNVVSHPCHAKGFVKDIETSKLVNLCNQGPITGIKTYYRLSGDWDFEKCLKLIRKSIDVSEKKHGVISNIRSQFNFSEQKFFGFSRLAEVAAQVGFTKVTLEEFYNEIVELCNKSQLNSSLDYVCFDAFYMYILVSEKLDIPADNVVLGHKEKLETVTGSMIYNSRSIMPRVGSCLIGKYGFMHIVFSIVVFSGLGVYLMRKAKLTNKEIVV